jgi:hypothetical protein
VDAIVWIVVAVVVVLVVLGVVVSVRRGRVGRRRDALRERFGPEYERAVRTSNDRGAAESRLEELSERRDALDIRPLQPASRARYDEQWDAVQARFVDEPGQAVTDADGLVSAVMRERGYPLEDFDDRAALLATDHPDVVAHYRAAHSAFSKHVRSGRTDTEGLRQAFVSYRSLFAALTRDAGAAQDMATAAQDMATQDMASQDMATQDVATQDVATQDGAVLGEPAELDADTAHGRHLAG